jgi:hypothetical protein
LAASGIDPKIIADRGYRSVTKKSELKELGFSDTQCRVPALALPLWDVRGKLTFTQIRPDAPRSGQDGKLVKYDQPRRVPMALDVPPAARPFIGNPDRPLLITEGVKKADSAVSRGLCCIALLGVWNWRGTNADGGTTVLADWESIALENRTVYIVFDSDVMQKPAVYQALVRLKGFLESRRALVRVIYLEPKLDGSKVGLDDFFGAGNMTATLLAQATDTLRKDPTEKPEFPYKEDDIGLLWLKPTREGAVEVPLCNFTARIISECEEDDGTDTRLLFDIAVKKGNREVTVRVPADKFGALNWPLQALGLSAAIVPGREVRDHIRFAVQMFSQGAPRRTRYTHLGWRKIGEEWVYLHTNGAIGAGGSVPRIDVSVPDVLEPYALPDPPTGAALTDAIRASLRFLTVAPLRVTAPVYASIWRAVLGGSNYSTHLVGATGKGKTALALLALQHQGAGFTEKTIPASWESTTNSLEDLAFIAKDTLLLVDDFNPVGSAADVQRKHRDADRVFRGQGNTSGRGRLTASLTQRAPKPPRGLLLSTGEDIPKGHSLRARTNIVEVSPTDVQWEVLTPCQADAKNGLYAQAMAGFLHWVAPQYDTIKDTLAGTTLAWRALVPATHRRTSDLIASLAVGAERFLLFAREAEAISEAERVTLWGKIWQALLASSTAQSILQADSDPAQRFVELITSALSSGRAHLAGPTGMEPKDYLRWGWKNVVLPNDEGTIKSHGEQIGWTDGENVYLDPESSFAVAQRLAQDQHDSLPVTPQVLRKRLKEKGYLIMEGARETVMVRRVLAGQTRSVLNFNKSLFSAELSPENTATNAQENGQKPNENANGAAKD